MTDTLATFADQVTTWRARSASTAGSAARRTSRRRGTWKDLTGNVNLLAANLTTQVRAIAEVATAVTKGDLTRSIQVETAAKVAELRTNQHDDLQPAGKPPESNRAQDWAQDNLAEVHRMPPGSARAEHSGSDAATELTPRRGRTRHDLPPPPAPRRRRSSAALQLRRRRQGGGDALLGEGLDGQCALEKKRILLTDVPPTSYGVVVPRAAQK
jgi:HAMP domain-containing protein